MPRSYPFEVRISVIQSRKEGYSWKEVKDLVRQRFELANIPSQRQMRKWVKSSDPGSLPCLAEEELKRRAEHEAFKDMFDMIPSVFLASVKGVDVGVMLAKCLLSRLEKSLGSERYQKVLREYEAESYSQKRGENESDRPGDTGAHSRV